MANTIVIKFLGSTSLLQKNKHSLIKENGHDEHRDTLLQLVFDFRTDLDSHKEQLKCFCDKGRHIFKSPSYQPPACYGDAKSYQE
jgi:hypothetical protein